MQSGRLRESPSLFSHLCNKENNVDTPGLLFGVNESVCTAHTELSHRYYYQQRLGLSRSSRAPRRRTERAQPQKTRD